MHYLVIDLEMSGDDPSWHDIIQIGAVLYTGGWKEVSEFKTNVYPDNEEAFSQPSAEVHGLTLEELQDAPMRHEALEMLEEWILKARNLRPDEFDNSRMLRSTMLAGLGLVNDFAFLRSAYGMENRKWPFSYRMLDMQSLTHALFPVFRNAGMDVPKRQSLDAISAFFGFEREGYDHDALEDARLTGECFRKLDALIRRLEYKAE